MCPPRNSAYYAAQSLGKSADIPSDLKNQIYTIQKEVDNAQNTSSKYYHVYGSAFLTCQLVQNGISPGKASLIQQQAARFYRGIRMCESVKDLMQSKERQNKQIDGIAKDLKLENSQQVLKALIKKAKAGEYHCRTNKDSKIHAQCEYSLELGLDPEMLTEVEISDEQVQQKVEAKSRNKDAAELYDKWYVGGGKVFGQNLLCSDLRVLGPSDLMKPQEGFFDRLSKPSGWTESRYTNASKKLATWDVDYKWTIAQHKAGADFAGKNCHKRQDGEKPIAGLCAGGTPDGVSSGEISGGFSSPSSAPQTGVR